MNLSKQIREYLSAVRKDVVSQMVPYGQHGNSFIASGRMKRNFRVVANQYLVGELRGVNYMQYNEKGMTTKPKNVSRKFIESIKDWMRFKGISPKRDGEILPSTSSNITRSAYGIAKGITEKGTPVMQGRAGLDIEGAMKRNINPFLESIGKEFFKTFDDNLTIK